MTLFLLFFLSFFHKLEDKKIIEKFLKSKIGNDPNYTVVYSNYWIELSQLFR